MNCIPYSPDTMTDIFPLNTSSIYDTRNREIFHTRPVKSIYKSTRLSLWVPKTCELIPESIESIDSLPAFKIAIKQWKPDFLCSLCRTYIPQKRIKGVNSLF